MLDATVSGAEKIPRRAFRVGIPQTITEDVPLLAFRFSGPKPMVGFRTDAVFNIVWLDRDFSVYNHGS